MKIFDFAHPFFKPVGIRVGVVVVCLLWGSLEFSQGAVFWGMFFCGLGAISGYRFSMIDYTAIEYSDKDADKE